MSLNIENQINITNVSTWDSGGDMELDLVELADGKILTISDEAIVLYDSMEDLMTGDASKERPTIFL